MKTKLAMILGALLFILPMAGATTVQHKKRRAKIEQITKRVPIVTRTPIDYTIEVHGDEECLQIVFSFPLHDANIMVTGKNGNAVVEETETNPSVGETITIYNPTDYPYTLELTSPTVDITGEIVLEKEN